MLCEPFVNGVITAPLLIDNGIWFTLDTDFVCRIDADHPSVDHVFEGAHVTCFFTWESQVLFDVETPFHVQQLDIAFISPSKFTYLDQPFLFGLEDG